jgi:hypothetical protein
MPRGIVQAPHRLGSSRAGAGLTIAVVRPVKASRRHAHVLGVILVASGMATSYACGSAHVVEPAGNAHGIVIAPGDSGRVIFADTSGRIIARLPLGIRAALGSAALTQRLYLATLLADGRRELVAVDLPTRTILWREPMTGQVGQRVISGIEVWAPDVMTLSPDAGSLVMSFARLNGRGGIASLDLATRSVAHFAPIVPRAGIATIEAGTLFPRGAVVVAGARDSITRGRTIYFLDPTDLAVLDSIVPSTLGADADSVEQVLPTRNGGVLFLNSVHRLLRFDTRTRTFTATSPKPVEGAIWLAQDEGQVVLPDGGLGPDNPGTGRVYVFDAQTLQPTGSVLLPPSAGGGPRVSNSATPGFTARQLYLVTGTARIGPNYPVDPAALIDLDLIALTVKRVIPLSDWAVGHPYVY